MKALKVLATTALTVAILGVQVLAAAPSPSVKGAVRVKKATTSDGTDITAQLVITPLSEMGSTPYAEVKAYLQSASDDFKAASDKPANLKGTDGAAIKSALQAKIDAQIKNAKAEDMVASEIFDVSYVVNGKVTALPGTTKIEFEYTAPDGSAVAVIHQVKAGAWKVEDGLTVSVDSLSPFSILTVKASQSSNEEGGEKSPQTGEYVTKGVLAGATILAALGIVCVVRAKKSSAN
ncbi:MAG: hypothetical protein K6E26_04365 [Clostridiales bacterium]|nr:hypothetical protein [Clostridiales bacterium]